MEYHTIIIMLILKLIYVACSNQQCQRNDMMFTRLRYKQLKTDSTNQIATVGTGQTKGTSCLGICQRENNCKSFNVIREDGEIKCVLFNVTRYDKPSYIKDDARSYFEVLHCDESMGKIIRNVVEAKDCKDVLMKGFFKSGVYGVTMNGKNIFLYCDMETHGGGWTVILRRYNGEINFRRNWDELFKRIWRYKKRVLAGKSRPEYFNRRWR